MAAAVASQTENARIDDVPPGANLVPRFKAKSPGVWELTLARPVTELARGKLSVSVKDRQGNVTRIERTFSVTATNR